MNQSSRQKKLWMEKFTPQTVEQYKIYMYIQEHFLPDLITVIAVSRDRLKITDLKESLELGIDDLPDTQHLPTPSRSRTGR